MTKINLRWLRATQMLNGSATIGALVMIGLILQEPARLSSPDWVIWLILIIGGFHTFEEYTLPGGFVRWFNLRYFESQNENFPLSIKKAFLTDALAFVMIMGVIALVGTRFYWLSLGAVSLMFINGAWHALDTITRGRYSPGTLSAILLNVPLGGYIIYFYLSHGYASVADVALAYTIGLLGHVLFYQTVRNDIQSHPEHLTGTS